MSDQVQTEVSRKPSFAVAAKAYGQAIERGLRAEISKANAVCQMYAIGFLSKMTKKQINQQGRDASGVTEDVWNSDKSTFSKAHRAIAGEYGFGERLALAWAAGDFAVSLERAYELSGAPRTEVDNIARVAKLLASMDAREVQLVLVEYAEIAHVMALKHNDVAASVKQTWHELVQVA